MKGPDGIGSPPIPVWVRPSPDGQWDVDLSWDGFPEGTSATVTIASR